MNRFPQCPALLVALVIATSTLPVVAATVDEASPEQLKTAKAVYDSGLEAMAAEKYSEALDQFKQSYALVSSPNSQLMVGRALIKLGKLSEAYVELSHALQQAKELSATQAKYQKTVVSAQTDLDDLKSKLAFVTLRKGTTAKIQGNTVGASNDDQTVAVMPGKLSVEVTYADGMTETKQLALAAGKKVELQPEKAAAVDKATQHNADGVGNAAASGHNDDSGINRKTLGYVVGGVGALGVATFVGFGLIGASVFGDTKEKCSNGKCSEAAVDNQGRKSLLQGIGYAGLGMGIAGLGIGAWLVFGGDDKSPPATALQLGPGMVQLHHRF